jgi:tyrosyl-tRNA synthetase
MFTRAGLSKSNSQALQMIRHGGVYVNNIRVEDSRLMLTPNRLAGRRIMVLRAGKKRYHLVRVEG